MNIERYKWPVIVAAGLHGALLLITPDRTPVIRPRVEIHDPGPKRPPVEPLEIPAREDTPSDAVSRTVEPLPGLPDIPPPPSALVEPFTISVSETSRPLREVVKLPDPGRVGNESGEGPLTFGPPRMPTTMDLDRIPRAMAQPSPDYPSTMKQAGITGSVMIEFVVGIDGRVITAEATRWTRREFAEPAVRAVLRWKFEPGTIGGRKVRFRIAVPIEFNAGS